MSTIIKFDVKELRKLAYDKKSCIVERKVTQNLALQPWCLGNLKESIKNLLDYKIGKYDNEFKGILLSYKNLKILQNVGTIRNDNTDIHFQVQADYFIFIPHVGATLTGVVNKKSITHLGILLHRVFNVVIPRPTEEPGNMWLGSNILEGQEVTFRIVVLDLFGALPYIRGELIERCIGDPEGDDDAMERKPAQPINVNYVNFDKTKPYNQKQSGDYLPHTTSKMPKLKNNSSMGESNFNGKSGSSRMKTVDSELAIGDRIKVKLHGKNHDPEQKATDGHTRSIKKHKRDVQF